MSIVNVGVLSDISDVDGVLQASIRAGTANLLTEGAMSEAECFVAIEVGRKQAREAIAAGANLLIAGDMGIGNTTASACIICRLTGADPEQVVGLGTGVGSDGLNRKVDVVRQALVRVSDAPDQDVLRELGGLEIAAMAGFYLQAAESGMPIVIDGFISSAAALVVPLFNSAIALHNEMATFESAGVTDKDG